MPPLLTPAAMLFYYCRCRAIYAISPFISLPRAAAFISIRRDACCRHHAAAMFMPCCCTIIYVICYHDGFALSPSRH